MGGTEAALASVLTFRYSNIRYVLILSCSWSSNCVLYYFTEDTLTFIRTTRAWESLVIKRKTSNLSVPVKSSSGTKDMISCTITSMIKLWRITLCNFKHFLPAVGGQDIKSCAKVLSLTINHFYFMLRSAYMLFQRRKLFKRFSQNWTNWQKNSEFKKSAVKETEILTSTA